MPATVSDAFNLLAGKLSVPSELRTAEFSMLPQWLRERIFYMAAVNRGEILEGFRGEVGAIASGARGLEESRKLLERMLKDQNYQPLPGQEGTIKDLASMRRIQTSLRTNVSLLQGWGQKNRGLLGGAVSAFPGWELVRFLSRKVPRGDWPERFERAGGELSAGGRMIALKDDPVWEELGNGDDDSIGCDYPPFAWGSGMAWRQVSRREMLALGLIDDTWTPPKPKPVKSPNESLETTPQIATREIRDALSQRLKGLAEWQDDTLVFTDPNGTRPFAPDQLAEVWARELPGTFQSLPGGGQMQREAVLGWMANHRDFQDTGDTNAWADLLRAAGRIESPPVAKLYRGISLPPEKLDGFLGSLATDTYSTRAEYPLESWTDSAAAADWYSQVRDKDWHVVLSVSKPQNAADFSPIVDRFADSIQGQLPIGNSEWVYVSGSRFRVLSKVRDEATRSLRIELEEVAS